MIKFVAASRESAAKLSSHGGGDSGGIQSKSKTDNRPTVHPDAVTNARCRIRLERRIHPADVQPARVAAG
jgi:hypothetical protein